MPFDERSERRVLTEDQIRQFSRQILLREVGGVGQQKLLAAPIEVIGWSDALEIAVTYLAAGGTPIIGAREGATFLRGLDPSQAGTPTGALVAADRTSAAPLQVVLGSEVLLRTPATCGLCWDRTRALVTTQVASPVAAGSLGALLLQRQVLGFAQESQRFVFKDGSFQPAELLRCSEHSKSVFPVQE